MSMQGRAGWPWPPGRALRARVSVLYFANKYRLFYCAWPGCGSPCSCVLGRACVSGAATHGPCRRGDVHPSQVVGVPGGWVGAQAGGVGQGGGQECAGGDPVYFRGAAAIRTAGPLSVRGQGHVPGPVRGCDVAALPALAGWGLPALPRCGGAGRRLGPAFGSSALHRLSASGKQPRVPQHSHPVTPQTLGTTVCGAPVLFAAGGHGDGAFPPPPPVVLVTAVLPQPALKGSCGCPVSPGCPPAWRWSWSRPRGGGCLPPRRWCCLLGAVPATCGSAGGNVRA